jgi:hypothetical protein
MGCGQSKVAGAVAPEGEATAARQKEGAEAVARPELRGGKLGASTGMVRTAEAQLERSLEDITGPMDPQQVQTPPPPRTARPLTCQQSPCHGPLAPDLVQVSGRGETRRLRAISVEREPHGLSLPENRERGS